MPSSTSSSSLRSAAIVAVVVTAILMGAWEAYWRNVGSVGA